MRSAWWRVLFLAAFASPLWSEPAETPAPAPAAGEEEELLSLLRRSPTSPPARA